MAPTTLLLPDWLIPVEPDQAVLAGHGIAMRDGRIADIAPHGVLRDRHPGAAERPLAGCALLPGFVNLHTHAAMSLLRGAGDDLPLMAWLQERIWPLERKLMSADFVYDGSVLAFAEMLAGGTTCCADMYFHPEEVARAALSMGIRAAVGGTVFEIPGAPPAEQMLAQALAAHEKYRGEPGLRFMLAPHAPYTVGDDMLRHLAAVAEEADLTIAIHLHETRQEVEEAVAMHGMRPAERLAHLGLLSPRLVAVHGVHLDADDIALLASHGVSLAHCPASNLKLASGLAPVARLLEAGVNLGIGTDGAASNNRLDMLSELRLAALLAKGASGDARALPAHRALHAATLGGAKALGWDDRIGSVAVGKYADLVAIRLDSARLAPVFDPVSHVVYAAGREDVEEVWIDGRTVAKKLQLTNSPSKSDLERIMSRISQWRLRAAGVISGTNTYLSQE
ncbi:TRZ/ATZ family hydrolase [Pigmentiphaga sp. GD03639]|uniref:TRZ/ATZ family hydrolase n=1 Tax=Pigmentiphaga sp. GD03639 TaxID=2975354 RepID=UPI0024483391|nr:TRZ/ATZ family hydrolase [Pigmentiphaga sp. GD03639]MDH2234754.1 TRZ/ATZ family hydrolase [Pigmentiphaga sp. GD03639]